METTDSIKQLCSHFDGRWQKRERIVNSAFLATAILKMVWSKNTEGYGSNLAAFWKDGRALGIILRKKTPISASSFCEARVKMSEEIFREINFSVTKKCELDRTLISPTKGLRFYAVDGSIIDLPRGLLKFGYGMRSEKSFYPQGLLSCLYGLDNGIPYDFSLAAHRNERFSAQEHLKRLGTGDVVVYDRGYFSYAMIFFHNQASVGGIFRLRTNKNFTEIQKFIDSDNTDEIITLYPEKILTRKEILKSNPGISIIPIKLRLTKATIEDKPYYFATTLEKNEITVKQIESVYAKRWSIEELYKTTKCLIGIEDFHSKTERGVKQEIYAGLLLITISRIIANQAEATIKSENTESKKK
jgi:hypothetical protein